MSQQPPGASQPPPPDEPPTRPAGDPSWPGPPPTWPGAPVGSAPGDGRHASAGAGDPGGPPPPPWRRRRRRWLLALAIVGALVVVGVPVGFGLAALSGVADDIELTSPSPEAPQGSGPSSDVEVEVPDLDGLEGTDAELGQVLVDVHRSEEEMLATQGRFAELFEEAARSEDPEAVDALLEDLAAAAGSGQRELQEIRRDLTSTSVDDGDVREIRDRYLAHLDAWVRYFVAIEDDPTLLTGGSDQAFLLAIDTTGDAFARTIREDLPADLDPRVRTFAEQIVDRGFPDREPSAGDTV